MLKAVIDTNVFISGLIKNSSCKRIIELLKEERFILIVSPQILNELIGVINRPKFHNIIIQETAEKLIETIKTQAIFVKPFRAFKIVKEDPTDNIFLEAAYKAKANFIISGDQHLILVRIFRNIPIITPKNFLEKLEKQ